ncbi:MAG: hypothetical protein R3F11_22845 [Verrucomicrobiales bacterium]
MKPRHLSLASLLVSLPVALNSCAWNKDAFNDEMDPLMTGEGASEVAENEASGSDPNERRIEFKVPVDLSEVSALDVASANQSVRPSIYGSGSVGDPLLPESDPLGVDPGLVASPEDADFLLGPAPRESDADLLGSDPAPGAGAEASNLLDSLPGEGELATVASPDAEPEIVVRRAILINESESDPAAGAAPARVFEVSAGAAPAVAQSPATKPGPAMPSSARKIPAKPVSIAKPDEADTQTAAAGTAEKPGETGIAPHNWAEAWGIR